MRRFLVHGVLVFVVGGAIYWLCAVYDAALRDVRFLDGWLLALVMIGQLGLHLRRGSTNARWGSVAGWKTFHLSAGLICIWVFVIHCGFTLPDSALEWVLWAAFAGVALSGMVGAVLSSSLPATLVHGESAQSLAQIGEQRAALARQARELAASCVGRDGSMVVAETYAHRLHDYFAGPRNLVAHVGGIGRPMARLGADVEQLLRYADEDGANSVRSMHRLVLDKAALDADYARRIALQIWLFVHVPVTYGLIVLSIVHIAIVYAFSSGGP